MQQLSKRTSSIIGVCARYFRPTYNDAKRVNDNKSLHLHRRNYKKNKIMETSAIQKKQQITDMKKRMSDIYLAISWREINRTYFDKSMAWFQHKMYGIDGNGGVGGFNEQEAEQLYDALNDLSNRIRRAAESIKAPANTISAAI